MNQTPESLTSPSVAEQQRQLGAEWADVYANAPVQSAEIALRNPAVYVRDEDITSLPEGLQGRWSEILDTSEKLVSAAETTVSEWGTGISGLDKLQTRMFDGQLKTEYSAPIAQIIRDASELFAESSQFRAGNTEYYAGNILGMQSWIKRYQG